MDILEKIKQQVESTPIVIYMKGTPKFPQCGYSDRAVKALQDCGVEFTAVNVLADREVYDNLPRYANWPTFPQIYVNGDLIGGCDITLELHKKGELKSMLEQAVNRKPNS